MFFRVFLYFGVPTLSYRFFTTEFKKKVKFPILFLFFSLLLLVAIPLTIMPPKNVNENDYNDLMYKYQNNPQLLQHILLAKAEEDKVN